MRHLLLPGNWYRYVYYPVQEKQRSAEASTILQWACRRHEQILLCVLYICSIASCVCRILVDVFHSIIAVTTPMITTWPSRYH